MVRFCVERQEKGGDNLRKFDKGVMWYTICNLDMNVPFPEDAVCCGWCPFIRHYDNLDRDKCALTGDILYSKEYRGANCPLVVINTTENGGENK